MYHLVIEFGGNSFHFASKLQGLDWVYSGYILGKNTIHGLEMQHNNAAFR